MRLNRKQKAYGCLVILGLGALIIDRATFTPQSASAQISTEDHALAQDSIAMLEQPAIGERVNTTSKAAATRQAIAQKLSDLAKANSLDPTVISNIFEPKWSRGADAKPETAQVSEDASRRFVESHQLSAVMGSGHKGVAIVDGRAIRVGGRIDGFRLISIEARMAAFESDGRRVTLEVPLDGKIKQMLGESSAEEVPALPVTNASGDNGR